MELSPLKGLLLPTMAEKLPECAVMLTEVVPVAVQPERLPVSNPPLVIPPGGGGAVTVRLTVAECVAEPSAPVTVRVYVPATAVPALTDSVELPPVVTEVGLSEAVAPEGVPLTVSETVPALPLVTAVLMVELPLLPCSRLSEVGLALMEKSLPTGAVTVRLTVAECEAEPSVPVTVSVYVPAAAVPALTDSVELPPAVTEVGLSEAVAPEGVPLTASETVTALPLVTAVLMVELPLVFCCSE